MRELTAAATDVRVHLTRIAHQVACAGDRFVMMNHGYDTVAIVSMADLEFLRKHRPLREAPEQPAHAAEAPARQVVTLLRLVDGPPRVTATERMERARAERREKKEAERIAAAEAARAAAEFYRKWRTHPESMSSEAIRAQYAESEEFPDDPLVFDWRAKAELILRLRGEPDALSPSSEGRAAIVGSRR